MKKKYSEPELEIVKFSFEDLLAPVEQSSLDSSPESGASGGDDNDEDIP